MNGSTGAWIDDTSNNYANDKIVELATGAHDYSRNFTIPTGTPDGSYDARWVTINDTTKNWMDSKEMWNIVTVKEKLPTGPVYNVNKSKNYDGIQKAIDVADPGNEIDVYSGTYYENIVVNKQLILLGVDNGSGKPTVDGNYIARTFIISANGVILENFNVIRGWTDSGEIGAGIFIASNDSIIVNNSITSNDIGIAIKGSFSNNALSRNLVSNNGISIYSEYASKNSFNLNNISNNGQDGILLFASTDNAISENIVESNALSGITLYYSINNRLNKNTVNANDENGITIMFSPCDNNTIYANNMSYNNEGIHFGYCGSSSNNKIYHNNFAKNIVNANETSSNFWDDGYPSGGNYWDDYPGIDSDGDGIGDTPYLIPGGISADRYPLIKPYSSS